MDLPVKPALKYETVLNMKTAKALGLEIPAQVIARVDEAISHARSADRTRLERDRNGR